MDQLELFLSCRNGDLAKVKYLIEQKEVVPNCRDRWDSTPLYYACLCGHEELARYLLENGARCEANTFDGERCLYGALTDSIKKLLLSYSVVSSRVIRRDLYEEFLRRLQEMGTYQDVTFHIHGHKFPAHRCVLSARSSYFAEMFRTRWLGRTDINLKHKMILPVAFGQLLQFLYTGKMEIHRDNIGPCIALAKQCKLDSLISLIEEKCKKLDAYTSSKPGVNITMVLVEQSDKYTLQMDFSALAQLALPKEFSNLMVLEELPFMPEYAPVYADVVFTVEQHKFYCHKAFFCCRSDYFKALVKDHFGEESVSEDNLPVIPVRNVDVDIFVRVLFYIYQDMCELNQDNVFVVMCAADLYLSLKSYDSLNQDNVFDVMCAADLYLLPGLKRYCANEVARYLTVPDVVMVVRTARMFNLPKLEDQCAEFIADNLEEVLDLQEFRDLVLEDAQEVKDRQETDSIDIIDSVRFHLTNFIQTYSEMEEAEEGMKLIDNFLMDLGLDC